MIPFIANGNHICRAWIFLCYFHILHHWCAAKCEIYWLIYITSRINVLTLRERRYFCVFGPALADRSCVSSFKIGVIAHLARPKSISGPVQQRVGWSRTLTCSSQTVHQMFQHLVWQVHQVPAAPDGPSPRNHSMNMLTGNPLNPVRK